MFSKTLFTVAAISAVAVAIPTPVSHVARSCTTRLPDILQVFSETEPSTIFPNAVGGSNKFTVSTDAQQTNKIDQGVAFLNLPPISDGPCTLSFNFPADSSIFQSGNPIMNVSAIAKGHSDDILPNSFSLTDLINKDAIDMGLFGTVGPFSPGQTVTVNSESCPTDLNGGGSLAFLFSIASQVEDAASVEFTQIDGDVITGAFLTFGC